MCRICGSTYDKEGTCVPRYGISSTELTVNKAETSRKTDRLPLHNACSRLAGDFSVVNTGRLTTRKIKITQVFKRPQTTLK